MKRFLTLVFALSLCHATSSTAQDAITLGLSVDQLFESRVGVNNAIKAEAEKRGYELIEVVADGDAQTQNQQIQSLITQGVDAILVCAVDQNTIERALMAAQRADIPVVAYDRDLPASRVVAAFVGPDSLADGREAGAYTAEQLKAIEGEKVIVELIGALNDQNGIDRSKGFREELASLDNVKLIEVPTDWDSARALSRHAERLPGQRQGACCLRRNGYARTCRGNRIGRSGTAEEGWRRRACGRDRCQWFQ